MEIRKERGSPQQLEKSLAKDTRLFHSSHRPNNKDLSIIYCRQRSTLRRLNFGPKDREHLNLLPVVALQGVAHRFAEPEIEVHLPTLMEAHDGELELDVTDEEPADYGPEVFEEEAEMVEDE
jgi:hypothetical protein